MGKLKVNPKRTCLVQVQHQLSLACQGLLGVVRGPAHGPRVDVVQLAACAWRPTSSHLPFSKSCFLRCLMEAGTVQWSPTGTRGSLPKIRVMGTM